MRIGIILGCCAAVVGCSSNAPPSGSAGPLAGAKLDAAKKDTRTVPTTSNPYTLFETLQTRPLALSADGKTLFALNTPDNRLEIFNTTNGVALHAAGSVVVGLEPVALAVRNASEVWVVNHLSDSVSIVRVDGDNPRVVRTLLVGDEPRDIVFAGAARDRAFITTAHRGQNSPDDPEIVQTEIPEAPAGSYTPPGGRADVWVFDANNLGASLAGTRLAKLTFFADTPRALAASADGATVYAAAFFSGNQTTTVSTDAVRHVYASRLVPGTGGNAIFWPGIVNPATGDPVPQPLTGLVVKLRADSTGALHWLDAYGTNFDAYANLSLPDYDVFAINANATPPVGTVSYKTVGTTLFNMAVNPKSGKVYVSNTDAHNDVRFEGLPGTVRGKIVDSRISVIDPSSGAVVHNNLNSHLGSSGGDPSLSRAFPQDLVVSSDGKTLYVVAQGSAKLAVYNTADLDAGSAAPTAGNQVVLSAGGPTGVVVDEKNGSAYVLTRFDNGISVVNLKNNKEHHHTSMYNPESPSITQGRPFLYDATLTSANGDQACASCHVGGDFDGLAWDLGNPAAQPLPITKAAAQDIVIFTIPFAALAPFGPAIDQIFAAYQPLKGPMTTQSLRGMDNHGAMHWRGDRNGAVQQSGLPFTEGGSPVQSAQPDKGMFNEVLAFESFNVAFPGLIGRASELTDAQMAQYTSFILDVSYPPNPVRALDNSLTSEQQFGQSVFFATMLDANGNSVERPDDRFHNCNGCHVLDPGANPSSKHPGFFGTDGRISFENETQPFKVAHLRNLYQKVGRYSSSPEVLAPGTIDPFRPLLNPALPSVRGFGFLHDGSIGDLQHFFMGQVFIRVPANGTTLFGQPTSPNPGGIPFIAYDPVTGAEKPSLDPAGFAERHAIVAYVMAFDSNMRPIVGQQTTLTPANRAAGEVLGRIALLEAQAVAKNADLVVKGVVDGNSVGFTYVAATGTFTASRASLGSVTDAQLRALVEGRSDALTFTAVPPGSGWRIGVDRDGDGTSDASP